MYALLPGAVPDGELADSGIETTPKTRVRTPRTWLGQASRLTYESQPNVTKTKGPAHCVTRQASGPSGSIIHDSIVLREATASAQREIELGVSCQPHQKGAIHCGVVLERRNTTLWCTGRVQNEHASARPHNTPQLPLAATKNGTLWILPSSYLFVDTE